MDYLHLLRLSYLSIIFHTPVYNENYYAGCMISCSFVLLYTKDFVILGHCHNTRMLWQAEFVWIRCDQLVSL